MLKDCYKKVIVDADGNKYESYKTIRYVHETPVSENSSNLQIRNNKAIMTINSLELTGGAIATTEDIVVTRSGKNLFDKNLVYVLSSRDFSNCTLIETTENGWIVKGNEGVTPGSSSNSSGWFAPLRHELEIKGGGIYLNEGDIITISADYTVLENPYPDVSYPANIYLWGEKPQTPTLSKLPPLNVTTKRSKTFTVSASGRYRPVFTLNSATIKIENIQVEIGSAVTEYEPYLPPKSLTFSRDYLLSLKGASNLVYMIMPTITKNGITFTNNGDRTITVDGTATAKSVFYFCGGKSTTGKLILLGCPSGGSYHSYNLEVKCYDTENNLYYLADIGNGNISKKQISKFTDVYIVIQEGQTVSNLIFKPQLYDLTAIYGAGNEPTTVEQFLKDCPLSSTDKITITKDSVKYNNVDITEQITGLSDFMESNTETAIIDTNYTMGSISADVKKLFVSYKKSIYQADE